MRSFFSFRESLEIKQFKMKQTSLEATAAPLSIVTLLTDISESNKSISDILSYTNSVLDEIKESVGMTVSNFITNTASFGNTVIIELHKQTNLLGNISLALFDLIAKQFAVSNDAQTSDVRVSTVTEQPSNTAMFDMNPIVTVLTEIKQLLLSVFRSQVFDTNKPDTEKPIDDSTVEEQSKFIKFASATITKGSNMLTNYLNNSVLNDTINTLLENIYFAINMTTAKIEELGSWLQQIYLYLPKLERKNDGSSNTSNDTKIANNEFIKLARSIDSMGKTLTKKFLTNFESFVKKYERFVDEKNTKKLMAVSTAITAFNTILNANAFLLNNVADIFNSLTMSIWMLTITLMLPPFQLGIIYMVGLMKTLFALFGGPRQALEVTMNVRGIAISLLMLIGAVYLAGKVDFGSLFRLLGFMTGLALVLKLFNKNNNQSVTRNISNKKIWGVSGIFSAAVGIAILVLTIEMASTADYQKAGALIFFIGGLATVLWIFNRKKIGKSGPLDSLANVSIGLSILLLVIDAIGDVNWQSAFILYGFIATLGLTIALAQRMMGDKPGKFNVGFKMNFTGKGMFGFALGIAILILCIDATNELTWDGTFKLLAFIAGVGFALAAPSLFSKRMSGGKPSSGMFGFAIGIAILLLCIDAAKEVDFVEGMKLIAFMTAVAGVLWFMQNKVGSVKSQFGSIVMMAGAITAMSLALSVFANVDISMEQVTINMTTIVGFVGILWVVSKNVGTLAKANFVMPMLVGSALAISTAMWIMSKSDVSYEQVFKFTLTAGVMVAIAQLAGTMKAGIIKGSIALGILSVSFVAFAFGMKKISDANPEWGTLLQFGIVVGVFTALAFGLSFIAAPVAIGAGVLVLLGVALIAIAHGFSLITNFSYNTENTESLKQCISSVIDALVYVAPKAVLGLFAAALLTPIAVATILIAGSLMLVNELKQNPENIKQFGKSIVSLIEDGYGQIGIMATGKAVIKAGMMIPIAASTLLVAAAMRAIQMLDVKPEKMSSFGDSVQVFVKTIAGAIAQAKDDLLKAEPALDAVAKLATAAGSIASVVETYANMKIGEWSYNRKTGKMEITNYRKIDNETLANVAKGIGTMIAALIEPLAIISTDDEYWNFGGKPVKNPFGKSGFFSSVGDDKGVNRVTMIASAFKDIPNIFNGLVANQLLVTGNASQFEQLGTNISSMIGIVTSSLNKLNTWYESVDIDIEDIAEDITAPTKTVFGHIIDTVTQLSKSAFWSVKKEALQRVYESFGNYVSSVIANLKKLVGVHADTNQAKTISTSYKSIIDSANTLVNSRLAQTNSNELSSSLGKIESFVNNSSRIFKSLADGKLINANVTQSVKSMKYMYESIDSMSSMSTSLFGSNKIDALADSTDKLLNKLADKNKFSTINKNLINTAKNVKSIVDNVNKIKVEKAAALERNLRMLAEAKTMDGIRRAIESLEKLIGMVVDVQEKQIVATNNVASSLDKNFGTDSSIYKFNEKTGKMEVNLKDKSGRTLSAADAQMASTQQLADTIMELKQSVLATFSGTEGAAQKVRVISIEKPAAESLRNVLKN